MGAQLGVQPLILERERRRGADCLDEITLLGKSGVVDDRRDPPSFMLDGGGDLALRRRIDAASADRRRRRRRPGSGTQ